MNATSFPGDTRNFCQSLGVKTIEAWRHSYSMIMEANSNHFFLLLCRFSKVGNRGLRMAGTWQAMLGEGIMQLSVGKVNVASVLSMFFLSGQKVLTLELSQCVSDL